MRVPDQTDGWWYRLQKQALPRSARLARRVSFIGSAGEERQPTCPKGNLVFFFQVSPIGPQPNNLWHGGGSGNPTYPHAGSRRSRPPPDLFSVGSPLVEAHHMRSHSPRINGVAADGTGDRCAGLRNRLLSPALTLRLRSIVRALFPRVALRVGFPGTLHSILSPANRLVQVPAEWNQLPSCR